MVKKAGLLSARMWDGLEALVVSPIDRHRLSSDMLEIVTGIEATCSRYGSSPSALGTPSRQAYCWLQFLLIDDNLQLHLNALDLAKQAILRNPPAKNIELHLANMNSIWRMRSTRNVTTLKLSEGFIAADRSVWQALIKSTVQRHNLEARGVVNEYVDSEEFSGVLFEMEAFARAEDKSPAGRVHDLDRSFDRVNSTYFANSIDRPLLHWNSIVTSRKFGHYEFARDTVMLSISLDDDSVMEHLVDYVMYHELLHKKHGVTLKNGRRMAHTSAFRRDERHFADYEVARVSLDRLARRIGAR